MDLSKSAPASEARAVFLHGIELSLKLCAFGGSRSLGKASTYLFNWSQNVLSSLLVFLSLWR